MTLKENFLMLKNEATARIKINKLLEESGWRFFDDENGKANIALENNVKITQELVDDLDGSIQKSTNGNLRDDDKLKNDDLVFVRSNGNPNLIGRCLIIKGIKEDTTFSGFTIRLRFTSGIILPMFFAYIVKLPQFRKLMVDGGNGANIKSLSQGVLSSLKTPLPPFETQKQIVERIEKEQSLVESNKELIKIFEQKIKDKISEVWGEVNAQNI